MDPVLIVTPRRLLRRLLAALLPAFAAVPFAAAQTVAPDTLRLADAVRIALETNPALQAARAMARAAGQRVGPAGALPDPSLQLGLMNRMLSGLGDTSDPMTMNQVQLMQMLPWPARLVQARRAARHGALAAEAEAEARSRELVAEVRRAYYDAASADRTLEVMRRTLGLLGDFREVTTTMYSVGTGIQQDVLRAQVEVARMSAEITRMTQERLAATVRLNALLGRDGSVAIGPLELPDLPSIEIPALDTLLAWALADRPSVRAGVERVAAADATLASTRHELVPDLQVGLQYQQRPAFSDMMSLMVGVSLPIHAGARQLPMRREAAAMRDLSLAELANLRFETAARVIELRARAEQDRSLRRLYRTGIVPQARAAVEAALAGYRVGKLSFMTLVDDQMTVNRYETESIRLTADYHQALGELEALVGRPLGAGGTIP